MLITEKRPPGTTYPQLKQVPTNAYADFLNFFRDGHTVDDNLAGPATQATLQYKMLETAIASGHLAKSKNKVNPDEFLLDGASGDRRQGEMAPPRCGRKRAGAIRCGERPWVRRSWRGAQE
jgi:hypothetical protein